MGERSFHLSRPTLLGAILIKARSLMVHDDPASQRADLLRLLSLVDEPRELTVELRDTERRWLRQAEARLDFQTVSLLSVDLQRRAELAYRLLTRSSAETDRSGAAVRRRSSQAPEGLHRRENRRGRGPLSR